MNITHELVYGGEVSTAYPAYESQLRPGGNSLDLGQPQGRAWLGRDVHEGLKISYVIYNPKPRHIFNYSV